MPHPKNSVHTADFEVPAGYLSFDLILSSDFTGTIGGVAYDGSNDAVQSYDGKGTPLGSMQVVVTTGTVRLAGVC